MDGRMCLVQVDGVLPSVMSISSLLLVLKQSVTTKDYGMLLLGARLQIFTSLGSKYVQVLSCPRAYNDVA
jgi:hypothetical protein